MYHSIQNFQVALFDKCLSDVHCPIVVTLQSRSTHNQEMLDVRDWSDARKNYTTDPSKPRYMSFRWKSENGCDYSARLSDLSSHLLEILKRTRENKSQEQIDQSYSKMCNALLQAAQLEIKSFSCEASAAEQA